MEALAVIELRLVTLQSGAIKKPRIAGLSSSLSKEEVIMLLSFLLVLVLEFLNATCCVNEEFLTCKERV
jgi:hypothetical protein